MIKSIPTIDHLNRLYYELAKIGARSVGANKAWPYNPATKEELIATACDMSRFDPRLLDILVEYFAAHWRGINPVRLRNFYKEMKCPQTVAVICEFLKNMISDPEVEFIAEYLSAGLLPMPLQFYFHNLYSPGGHLARRATEEGLYEFKKWGFLACERPANAGSLDKKSRLNILKRMVSLKKEIMLNDYLKAVQNSISRQQALADIKASGIVKPIGHGRGARWKIAA